MTRPRLDTDPELDQPINPQYGLMYDPILDQIILVRIDPARVYTLLAGLIIGVKDKPPPIPQ